MRKLKITSLALLLGLVVISSCKNTTDPEPSAEDKQLELLVGTWSISSATFDSAPRDWPNFSLTMAATSYTSTGHPDGTEANTVWKLTDSWEFVGKGTDNVNVSKFTRGDGVEVSISSIDANNLTLTFVYDENVNGRTSGISGPWVFKMTK